MAEQTAKKQKVLIVDDEKDIRSFFCEVAEGLGCSVVSVSEADAFKAAYRESKPDRIILDLQLKNSDGVELLRFLAEEKCQAEIILVSGVDKKTLMTAERLGRQHGLKMDNALQKPLTLEVLENALKSAPSSKHTITKDDILAALAEDQMAVFFQPQIQRQKDGNWIMDKVEALVRWNHPKLGFLTPDKFIALTEELGLISLLTDYVLQKSLQHMKKWDMAGTQLSIAVNLSGKQMADLQLPDHIESQLKKYSIAPARVMLELTETAVMDDVRGASEVLTRLRLKGFNLSLDDFGTGYSSLVQLYRLPFSELKIDRSFVMDVHTNKEAEVIVRALVDLAHNLGLKACAEGIEDKKTFEFLEDLGCKDMQGYYFSKPVAADDLLPTIKRWQNQQIPCRIKGQVA
jgi:EAL domain-containing protein (putative c-di-GMP-specific phosphodiesterase class I)